MRVIGMAVAFVLIAVATGAGMEVASAKGVKVSCSEQGDGARSAGRDECVARVRGRGLDMNVGTVLGAFLFERCDLSYRLHIDERGVTRATKVLIMGTTPCNDVRACFKVPESASRAGQPALPKEAVALPWRGRIVRGAGGTLRHEMDVCLDTCMGRFAGRVSQPLRPTARGWTTGRGGWSLGSSGWEMAGTIDLTAPDLKIESRNF